MAGPDIFLSYNRSDAAAARRFADAFAAEGFAVWWDATLRSGEHYDKVTEDALRNASAVVVLWSKASVESRWVRAEATLADRNRTLVPAMIEPCERPVMFELTQTAELMHWKGDRKDPAWRAFAGDVRGMVGREQAAPAAPAAQVLHGSRSAFARLVSRARWPAAAALLVAALVGAFAMWPRADQVPTYSVSLQPFRGSGGVAGFDGALSSALTSNEVPTAGGSVMLTLTGAIDERGGITRVNARLVHPEGGEVVWSNAQELPSDAPEAFEAAAVKIANVMQCTLPGANDAGGTLSVELLSRFARACELVTGGRGDQGAVIARGLTRDYPDFPGGWFALTNQAARLNLSQPDNAVRREGLAAADKLIELRPEAQEGYIYKAALVEDDRPVEREALLRRAAQMEPIFVDVGGAFLGDFLFQVGRFDEAFGHYRAHAAKNPNAEINHLRVLFAAVNSDREPVVEQVLARVAQLDATGATVRRFRWRQAVWGGDWAAAERLGQFETGSQAEATLATYRALASGDADRKEAAARLVLGLGDDCCVYPRIELLTLLGRRTEAIALLEQLDVAVSPGRRPGSASLSLWDPALRPLWRDTGFLPFLRRHGFIAYWRASKSRPDLCGEAGRPPFCAALG